MHTRLEDVALQYSRQRNSHYRHAPYPQTQLSVAEPVPPKYGSGRQQKPSRLQKRLAVQVRLYRERRGMTAEQLADKVGVRADYIQALERAERNITLRTLEAIARVLRTPAERLLKAPGTQDDESESES